MLERERLSQRKESSGELVWIILNREYDRKGELKGYQREKVVFILTVPINQIIPEGMHPTASK